MVHFSTDPLNGIPYLGHFDQPKLELMLAGKVDQADPDDDRQNSLSGK